MKSKKQSGAIPTNAGYMHKTTKMSSVVWLRATNGRQDSLQLAGVGSSSAFTIVELLIVIVVIGVLAAITIVSYSGITSRANQAALTSDLANAKKQLSLYYAEHNVYPTSLDSNLCPINPAVTPNDTNYCLKASSGNTLSYYGNQTAFNLTSTKGTTTYGVSSSSSPIDTTQPTDCPSGFIPVPGSATYGTKGFCVMKYEAKIQGNDNGTQTYSAAFVPESRAAGTPWVNINQTNAMAEAQTACTGCHLISEAEWMTLAQNVLSVPSNWSGGGVGNGYIYSGHNDGVPASSLVASVDADGYSGTGNVAGSNQRRTLSLTNNEIIWDLAGNAEEWTDGQLNGGQPGNLGESSYSLKNWNSLAVSGNFIVNPTPVFTGVANADTWTASVNGIGGVYSNSGETALRGFLRGGHKSATVGGGVLSIGLSGSPSLSSSGAGFRVAR